MLKVVIESKDYRQKKLKIDDYLHKTSRYIINRLIENQIEILVIGNNPNWKQGINLGKKQSKFCLNSFFEVNLATKIQSQINSNKSNN